MAVEVHRIVAGAARLGEGPVWDARAGVLWWVDIAGGAIHRHDPSGGDRVLELGEPVGCVAPRGGGGLVAALKSGLAFVDFDTGAVEHVHHPEADRPDNRFNDGTTDRQGRFWAGTMRDGPGAGPGEGPGGAFYRMEGRAVTHWRGGIHTTNGLAFSPDGRRMYFSDSHPSVRTIWRCDYDPATGTPGEASVFLDTTGRPGRPDGGTVDADGCYWSAAIEGWQVIRVTPDGRVDRVVDLPVEKPTKPMWGGPDLSTLYVTSLAFGLSDPARQPDAGGLFAVTGLGAQGVPEAPFAG